MNEEKVGTPASVDWDKMMEKFLETVPPDVAVSMKLISAKHGAEKFAFALNCSRVSYGMQGVQGALRRMPPLGPFYQALGDGAAFITEFACAAKGWAWLDILFMMEELDQAFAMAQPGSIALH